MEKELLRFIEENGLSPFTTHKSSLKNGEDSIYQTRDAKSIHNKVLSNISNNFFFAETSNLFNLFSFTTSPDVISSRQDYFRSLPKTDNSFLSKLKVPKAWWKPKYGIVVVTEDEKTYNELSKLECPIKFLITESDLESLDDYDIVQVIDCENFSRALENLPQAVFIDDLEDIYLERYLHVLSGWKDNLDVLLTNAANQQISEIVNELSLLLPLISDNKSEMIKRENVEAALLAINRNISDEIKNLTVSGDALFTMLSKSTLPEELTNLVRKSIIASGLPANLFTRTIPVEIDEQALDELINRQNTEQHTSLAERIKKKSDQLTKIPSRLKTLSDLLILFDFNSGISRFVSESFPSISDDMSIDNSSNLFLEDAQPVSFHLNDDYRCSILTGANSGGKTTLLEHIIQLITLTQLGLSISGRVNMPLFSEVYYFAKNKGSMNKGAFETLLTQMSKIKPGKKTLILADEIESVTEPGVAGAIISATADFFIKQGCFLVVATHLGKEIQKALPMYARVDGIEAKGLDERFELIVDHNPVLGRLANSTPELIIERMANTSQSDYFSFLYSFIKKDKV